MAKDLVTGWKRIGRSGPATDGRDIKPEMIRDAAANYDKNLFTALIWPEHFRYINLGTVEALKAQDNEEGGVDLFAQIAPNEFYISANKAGQKLFTSMEVTPNFRKSGQWYLTGLGATDDPASAATSELRFSKSASAESLISKFVDPEEKQLHDDSKSFFKKLENFFKQSTEEDEMSDKAEIEALKKQQKELEDKFSKLAAGKNGGSKEDKKPLTDDEKFNAMIEAIVEKMSEKFGKQDGAVDDKKPLTDDEKFSQLVEKVSEKLADKFAKQDHGENDKKTDKAELEKLKEEFSKISKKLDDALKEQPGTSAGEHTGDQFNAGYYI